MISIEKILLRVTEISGARSDSAIAKELSVSPQAIGNARKRGTIPYEKLFLFAQQHNVSLDYLFLGKGMQASKLDLVLLDKINEARIEAVLKLDNEGVILPQIHDMDTYDCGGIYNRIVDLIQPGDTGKDIDLLINKEVEYFISMYLEFIEIGRRNTARRKKDEET